MKVFLVGFSTRTFIPYIEKYENSLKKYNCSYDILFWDRSASYPLKKEKNEYFFGHTVPESKALKFPAMLRFRKAMKQMIKQNNYTHVIMLTTLPAVLIYNTLVNQFKGKYILDIRDYSYEIIKPYKKIVDFLVTNSSFTTISSKGFLQFLSRNEKLVSVHNITNEEAASDCCPELKNLSVVRLGFVGGVRYFKENIALINQLKNDKRFQLFYIGKQNADCNLEAYCTQVEINNVHFTGAYVNTEKPQIYKNIDMINSIYGNFSLEVTTALPNRLYDCILFKKPILVSKGTYLGELVSEYNLGLAVDVSCDDISALIVNYIRNFNVVQFMANCNQFLQMVNEDEQTFFKKLIYFLDL